MCKGSEERTRLAGLRTKRTVWWELREREGDTQDLRSEKLAAASRSGLHSQGHGE